MYAQADLVGSEVINTHTARSASAMNAQEASRSDVVNGDRALGPIKISMARKRRYAAPKHIAEEGAPTVHIRLLHKSPLQ